MSAAPTYRVHDIRALAEGEAPVDHVVLSYEDRLIRRKRLSCASGQQVMVDLPHTVSLDETTALLDSNGAIIGVRAAAEDLLAVTGPLAQLAWHIGNRHTPCEITEDRIVIRAEKVMAEMLTGLGATLAPFRGPFRPGGGAYGHGRTMGHSHDHSHDHSHGHSHSHGRGDQHDHDHAHGPDGGHDPAHSHSHDHGPHSHEH